MSPLAFDISTGFTMVKVATYSTIPRALRGASSISVITALRRSFGSISPMAVPLICSYGPAEPNERPAKIGVVCWEMTIFVTRASTEQIAAIENATAKKVGSALWNFAGRIIETSSLIFNRYGLVFLSPRLSAGYQCGRQQ